MLAVARFAGRQRAKKGRRIEAVKLDGHAASVEFPSLCCLPSPLENRTVAG